jgi:hypothetical protein
MDRVAYARRVTTLVEVSSRVEVVSDEAGGNRTGEQSDGKSSEVVVKRKAFR